MGNSCQSVFPNTVHGNSTNEIDKEKDKEGKKRALDMERSIAGTKKKLSVKSFIH